MLTAVAARRAYLLNSRGNCSALMSLTLPLRETVIRHERGERSLHFKACERISGPDSDSTGPGELHAQTKKHSKGYVIPGVLVCVPIRLRGNRSHRFYRKDCVGLPLCILVYKGKTALHIRYMKYASRGNATFDLERSKALARSRLYFDKPRGVIGSLPHTNPSDAIRHVSESTVYDTAP